MSNHLAYLLDIDLFRELEAWSMPLQVSYQKRRA